MLTLMFGASSMIGQSITKQWINDGTNMLITMYKNECNCLDAEWLDHVIHKYQAERIINLTGYNGNLTLNAEQPAAIFYETVQCSMNILAAAVKNKVQKVLTPISSCAYDGQTELLKDSEFLNGKVHESVFAHGMARRCIYSYGQCLNKQFAPKTIFVFPILNNCFGPHDRFNEPKRLKVFGTLIQRMIKAKRENLSEIEVWGDGESRREGLYVDDASRLIIEVLNRYEDYTQPINLGLGTDISIFELVQLIRKQVGYNGRIFWNSSKSNGQRKKLLDVTKALNLGFQCEYSLEKGIIQTINWYKEYYK